MIASVVKLCKHCTTNSNLRLFDSGAYTQQAAQSYQQNVTHPMLLQGKRHPAEGLLSPRDEVVTVQRSQNRRGADRVTPGPEQPSRADQHGRTDQHTGGEQSQSGRGGRGRGKAARGGRASRADDVDQDSRAEQGRATSQAARANSQTARATNQPGRASDAAKPPSSKVALKLFTADRQVRLLSPLHLLVATV